MTLTAISNVTFLFFAPIIRVHPAALTVRVHPTAPTVRMHPAALTTVRVYQVPRPVRVRLQGGCVRNRIKVNWI